MSIPGYHAGMGRLKNLAKNAPESRDVEIDAKEAERLYRAAEQKASGDERTAIAMKRALLGKPDVADSGFLLDGFPRTEAQARALVETLGNAGIDLAVNIEVPLDIVRERIAGRNRADDNAEAVERRLQDYEDKTMPAVRWFGTIGKLVEIDGVGSESEVFARLAEVIDAHL